MTVPFTGGCLCGAVRYECHAKPMYPGHYHCKDCQKASGGGNSSMRGLVAVMAGSMDDPSWLEPAMNVFTASAQPWSPMNADLPKFPGMPEMPEGDR